MSGAHMVCEKINLGRRKKSVLGSGGRWGRERTSIKSLPESNWYGKGGHKSKEKKKRWESSYQLDYFQRCT